MVIAQFKEWLGLRHRPIHQQLHGTSDAVAIDWRCQNQDICLPHLFVDHKHVILLATDAGRFSPAAKIAMTGIYPNVAGVEQLNINSCLPHPIQEGIQDQGSVPLSLLGLELMASTFIASPQMAQLLIGVINRYL